MKVHRRLTGFKEDACGQGMVEFALVVTFLVLVIMGIADLGRAVFYYNSISAAAREGARQAMICGASGTTDCSTQDAATKTSVLGTVAGVPIDASNITISPTTRGFGNVVTVKITASYTPITPLLATFGVGSISLQAQSSMIVE
jgi:Flp pilus assembly protein TadG